MRPRGKVSAKESLGKWGGMHNEAFKLGKEVSYRLGIVITI